MKKIIILLFCILSLNSFAEDVEVVLTSPIISTTEYDFNITGINNNSGISNTNNCNQLITGYDSCVFDGDILTVVYPLYLTTNIQSGFMGTLYIDFEPDSLQYFHSLKLLENDNEISNFVELYENDVKNYKIEIKIKYKGENSFSQPKGAINFTLNATSI